MRHDLSPPYGPPWFTPPTGVWVFVTFGPDGEYWRYALPRYVLRAQLEEHAHYWTTGAGDLYFKPVPAARRVWRPAPGVMDWRPA